MGYNSVMEASLEIMIAVFFFIFGTLIGSFLNVVILRHNTGKDMSGRSSCQSCGSTLSPLELIPVLSFLIQKGVCRVCKSKVSIQYPLVEIVTGLMFLLVFFTYTSVLDTIISFIVISLLVVIVVYDLRHGIIPNKFVFGFIAVSIFTLFFDTNNLSLVLPNVLEVMAGPVLAVPIWFLWRVSNGRWIGLGDAKLFLGIGWLLGMSAGITAFALSFWIGATVSLLLMFTWKIMSTKASLLYFFSSAQLIKKLNLRFKDITIKTEIPFAPFMILSFFIVYFFGINLISIIN